MELLDRYKQLTLEQKLALFITGPVDPVPADSRWELEEMQMQHFWHTLSPDERVDALRRAKAMVAMVSRDMGRPVLQEWAMQCSLMQQSVLMGIVRGPDDTPKYHPVKPVLRWYRRCLLLSALDGQVITDPYDLRGGSFTGPSLSLTNPMLNDWKKEMWAKVDDFMQHMDQYPIHFWLHMMHAIEIMGYHHSDLDIREWWNALYQRMVHAMHVFPESQEQLDKRLGDTREGWVERSDPAVTK